MAKINFSKIESSLSEALRQIMINRLSELAAIMMLIRDPNSRVSKKQVEDIINHFRNELKKLKEKDIKFYSQLEVTSEDEEKFSQIANFSSEDWERLKHLKEKIDELKQELHGHEQIRKEDEERIEKERIKHINKRFNIRENWIPLH